MEWDFTPQQVVKAEIDYGLPEFRRDLRHEIEMNMPGTDDTSIDRSFRMLYDLCYWLATGRDYREFERAFTTESAIMFLRAAKEHQQANVEMLGSILQRMIMDGVAEGLSVDDAVARVADAHRAHASN